MKKHVFPSLIITSFIALSAMACEDTKGTITDDPSDSSNSVVSSGDYYSESEDTSSSGQHGSSSSSSSSEEDLSDFVQYNPSLYIGGNGVTTFFEKNKTQTYYSLTNLVDPKIVDDYGTSPNDVYIPNTSYETYIKDSFDVSHGQKVSISFTVPMFNPNGSFAFTSKNDGENPECGHFFVSLLNADTGVVLARVKMEFWKNQYTLGNHKCYVALGNAYPSSVGTQDEIVGGWINGDATLNSSFYFSFDKKNFFQTKFGNDSVYEASIDNSEGALNEYFTNNIQDIKRVKFEISGDGGWNNEAKIILNKINDVTLSSVKSGNTGYIKKSFGPTSYQDGNPVTRVAIGEKVYVPYFISDLFGPTHETITINGQSIGNNHEYTVTEVNNLAVNYEGTDDFGNAKVQKTFNVETYRKQEITPTVEIVDPESIVYDGTPKYPEVIVRNGAAIIDSSEYTVEYSDEPISGYATVFVNTTNKNFIFDEVEEQYQIKPRPVELIWAEDNYYYNGSEQTITATAVGIDNQPLTSISITTNPETFQEPGDYVATATLSNIGERRKYTFSNPNKNYTMQMNVVPDVSVISYSGTYDGNPHSIQVSAPIGSVITYCETPNGTYTSTNPSYTDAGARNVYFKVDKVGYDTYSGHGTVTITGIQINSIIWQADNFEYNGSVQTITASYLDLNSTPVDLAVTTSPSPFQNVGTYTATASFTHGEVNYRLPAANTKQYTMRPQGMEVTLTPYNGTYDGNSHGVTVNAPLGSTITYAETQDGSYSETPITLTNAGSKTVYVRVEKAGYATFNGSSTITINPVSITSGNLDGFVDAYHVTGSAITPIVTLKNGTTTLLAGTDYDLSGDISATDVGNYSIAVTCKGNYTGAFNIAWAITNDPQPFETEVNIADWTYGDTASTPSVTYNPGGGAVIYQYKVQGASDNTYTSTVPTAAGNYTIKATIAASGNYLSSSATNDFAINPKAITPTISFTGTSTYTYNGTARTPTVSVTYNSVLPTDEYNVSYTNNVNAGTATVTVTGTKNYTFSVNKDFTINPANPVTSAPSVVSALTYNGDEQNLVNAGTVANGTIQYSIDDGEYSSSLPTGILPGTYSLKYKVTGTNSNYNDVSPTTIGNVTINKKADSEYINAWMFAGYPSGVSSKFESTGSGTYEEVNVVDPNDYNLAVRIPNDSRFNDAFDISDGKTVSIEFSMPMFTESGGINYVSGNDWPDGGGGVHFYLNIFNADTGAIICRLKWVIWADQYNINNHQVYLGVEGTNGSWPGDTDDYLVASPGGGVSSWIHGDPRNSSSFYFSFDKVNYLQTLFGDTGVLGKVDTSGNRLKTYLDANISSITHIRFEISGDNGFQTVSTQPIIKVRKINNQPVVASAVYDGNWEGKVIDNVGPMIWETGVVPTAGTTKAYVNLPLMAYDVLKDFDWFIYVDGKYKGQGLSFKINTTGVHTVRAYAVDTIGNASYKEYSITIS